MRCSLAAIGSWQQSAYTQTNRRNHTASMRLRIEVPNLQALGRLLERLSRLNNVISAMRLSDDGVERAG